MRRRGLRRGCQVAVALLVVALLISGLVNCRAITDHPLGPHLRVSVFSPYSASRRSASALLKPSARLDSRSSASDTVAACHGRRPDGLAPAPSTRPFPSCPIRPAGPLPTPPAPDQEQGPTAARRAMADARRTGSTEWWCRGPLNVAIPPASPTGAGPITRQAPSSRPVAAPLPGLHETVADASTGPGVNYAV